MDNFAITVCKGPVNNPQGRIYYLDEQIPVDSLAIALNDMPRTEEAWWSVAIYKDDRRSKENWLSAIGVGVDVDFHDENDEHAAIPAEQLSRLKEVAATMPGTHWHLTPRGFRVVAVFNTICSDAKLWEQAASGFGQEVSSWLIANRLNADFHNRLAGFVVDSSVLCDRARLLYTPQALVKRIKRDAKIEVLRQEPYEAQKLAELVTKFTLPKTRSLKIVDNDLDKAVEAFNRDHARDWGTPGKNDCPICGHHFCFGKFPEVPSRWYCWSSNHGDIGVDSKRGHHGDVLDIEAHAAGCSRIELLKKRGYLKTPAQREEPPPPDDPPAWLNDDAPEPVDITPHKTANGTTALRVVPKVVDGKPIKVRGGKSYVTLCNILRIPEYAARLFGEMKLEFNVMSQQPELGREPIVDHRISSFRELIERNFLVMNKKEEWYPVAFRQDEVWQAIIQVSHESSYHPIQDYLGNLQWDGVERINLVATDILGLENPTQFQLGLIRRWFIGAVARALEPGCKVDNALILAGPQHVGKSTFFANLAGPWFSDADADLSSRDGKQIANTAWIWEWSELSSMKRTSQLEITKAFMSRRYDEFVGKWQRAPTRLQRSFVIVGTTNEDAFLADETGNRRFWAIKVGKKIAVEKAHEQRDQLWAEAVAAYKTCEVWWLDEVEEGNLTTAQTVFETTDPWEIRILEWIQNNSQSMGPHYVTTSNLLDLAVLKPIGQTTRADEMRVAAILKRNGFKRHRVMTGGRRLWVYSRVQETA